MALSGHNNPASISELLALNISGRDLTRLACRSRSMSPRIGERVGEPACDDRGICWRRSWIRRMATTRWPFAVMKNCCVPISLANKMLQ